MTLRVVAPSERQARKKRLSVTQAAMTGSHRELLAAMRDRIAVAVQDPNVPAVALAALTRQLGLISQELTIMDMAGSEDGIALAAGTPDEDWSAV